MNKIVLILMVLSTNAFATDFYKLTKGLKKKTLKMKKVKTSKWLDNKAEMLEIKFDFHEDVSYVGEDWESVSNYCGWDIVTSEKVMANSTVSAVIDWNKVVHNRRFKYGKTKAYALFLFASIESFYGNCLFPRSNYAITKRGKVIEAGSSSDLFDFYTKNQLTEQ